jgi:hypothetical protein
MGLSPDVLYSAILSDVRSVTPFGPVALGNTPPDASYRQIAASQLLYTLRKKFIESSDLADDLSREKFLSSNKRCKNWRLRLDSWSDEQLYGEFRKEIYNFFHPNGQELISSYRQILDEARVGPGSSVGARGQSMYAKLFSSQLTTTSNELYVFYSNYIKYNRTFSEAECYRRERFDSYSVVNGSRSCFVPKTKDESRMICIEPSLNMFFQLGLGAILEKRLRSISIDLKTQPEVNRRLAHLGSIDGSISTIDLTSASDSISLRLCRTIFPRWFYQILVLLRSPKTNLNGDDVHLNMISTMGNGFTFPLQTIIFSCLIRAVHRTMGFPIYDGIRQNWSCFGDDLICSTRCVKQVLRLLNILGFTPNDAKTFFEGPFRESCGTDWFHGQPVRGVYIRSLSSKQDLLVAINLLNAWTAYTGISLYNGIQYLVSGIKGFIPLVPLDENIDSGVRFPYKFLEKVRRDSNGSFLYKGYRVRPYSYRIKEGGIRSPGRLPRLIYNPSGLYLSAVYGELKDYKIPARHSRVLYSTKQMCTPNWDHIRSDSLTNGLRLSWQQWETAVARNGPNP